MIRAKLVLRNVISKPLRTAIIILSLAAAAFAALFCISGIHSAQNGLRDFFSSSFGNADVMIASSQALKVTESDLPQGSRLIGQAVASVNMTVQDRKYINYVNRINISIVGIDTQKAYEMRMIDAPFNTSDGITITRPLAAQFDKNVGDTMKFYGYGGVEYELKIVDIVTPSRLLNASPMAIVTTPELANEIGGNKKDSVTIMYADIPEDKIADAVSSLREKYPDHYIVGTTSFDSDDTMDSILNFYYLIFAVVFLMVCFIVVSMSKHIVNERMSVIGMLRSIGGSIRGTGLLLLCESAFYGLCGGLAGTLLFLPLRSSTELGFFAPSSDLEIERSDGITPGTIILIIIAVILIQCVFSLAAIVKAAKTPVRDIIFGTKETAYVPSKFLAVFGGILLVAGIGAYCLIDDFLMTVVAAFCSVIGAVLIFPMVLSWISGFLSGVFGKAGMPVAKLAVKECASTKSNVSSAQLILSAMSLTIAVLVLSVSLLRYLAYNDYSTELMIQSPEQYGVFYTDVVGNVDGVSEVENLFYTYQQYESVAKINGEDRDLLVMGYDKGGFKYFTAVRNLPDSLDENEAAIDTVLASKLSLHEGDEITVSLNNDKFLPFEKKLKIKKIIDAGYFNSMGNTFVIDIDLYKQIFYDYPHTVLIKTEPGKEFSVLEILKATLPDSSVSIMTVAEYEAQKASDMQSILSIVYAVAVLGLALSLMGTSSNILMGFEQSRRKYAVYYSSSMSKGKLKKLILLETIITNGISALFSVILGLYILQIIDKALKMLMMSVPLVDTVSSAILFGIAVFAILIVVIIKPVRMLSKMNIAEEIKTSAD